MRAVVCICLFAAGCASAGLGNKNVPEAHPREIAARVTSAGWSKAEVHRGNDLYAWKCGRCHKFYDPSAYDQDDWNLWIRKMSRKAKLELKQEELLSSYLGVARKANPSP